jgi:CRISPR-associated endonuclease/helicase Cas3
MAYLAHSANKVGVAQTYEDHVRNVRALSRKNAEEALHYALELPHAPILNELAFAAAFHDLGKLEDENQEVLAGTVKREHLPIPHADAGAAYLLSQSAWWSTLWVYSHHQGLPDLSSIEAQDEDCRFRARSKECISHTNRALPQLLARHDDSVPDESRQASFRGQERYDGEGVTPLACRLLFGCLTDADHGDTATVEDPCLRDIRFPELRAGERLAALKARLREKYPESKTDRDKLRSAFFDFCSEKSAEVEEPRMVFCDAPVGSGKTTAVMAHLLSVAQRNGLRRIFVILPFTNIITQSVAVYRGLLCLDGESSKDVVAEIHHRADFEDARSRRLTALWNAPIVVTTAVAFFETLASATPSTLRRLHNLAGSAIFLDEAHAMLPLRLMPLAWQWIQCLAQGWSCHWVLGSGSLFHFWEWEEFQPKGELRFLTPHNLLEPVPELKTAMDGFERSRVTYRKREEPMDAPSLVEWLVTLEGPVIVVVNTVSSAAFIAHELQNAMDGTPYETDPAHCSVYHISTALCPSDRDAMIAAVKERLSHEEEKTWFLVATSCVEAGVDFPFRTGVRESASLLSLLQLAGRVNRNARFADADVWTITLQADGNLLTKNPAYDTSSRILANLDHIDLEKCTEVVKKELRESQQDVETLLGKENCCEFKTVEELFRVIPGGTIPVVVDQDLIKRIEEGEEIDWREVQMKSVSIRKNGKKFSRYAICECAFLPGLYFWTLDYNRFLGYMAGGLQVARAMNNEMTGGAQSKHPVERRA